MSLHRHAARRDANEKPLVRVIRQVGGSWLPVSVPHGPDGVIGFQGRNYLAEIKTARGRVQAGQRAFHEAWRGDVVYVLRTESDVLNLLGITS